MFLVSFLQTVIFYSKKIWNETDNIKYDNRDDVNEREFEKNLRDIEVAPFMKGKEHIIEQISTLKTFFDEETKFRSLIKSQINFLQKDFDYLEKNKIKQEIEEFMVKKINYVHIGAKNRWKKVLNFTAKYQKQKKNEKN